MDNVTWASLTRTTEAQSSHAYGRQALNNVSPLFCVTVWERRHEFSAVLDLILVQTNVS